jgi:hypothetical protein
MQRNFNTSVATPHVPGLLGVFRVRYRLNAVTGWVIYKLVLVVGGCEEGATFKSFEGALTYPCPGFCHGSGSGSTV